MLKRKNEQGFTLLEVAMVLIVASLIVVATLYAQGVWDTAKSFRLERQVQELKVAVVLFENKMDRLPGDSVPDGEIDNPLGSEWFVELNEEGLVASEARANRHPFAGDVELEWFDTTNPSPFTSDQNLFVFRNVPGEWAEALDNQIDDGDGTLGSVLATVPGTPGTAVAYAGQELLDVWIRLN